MINGDNMENNATFEENMKKLGIIVSELEKGEIPLDKAVKLYGEESSFLPNVKAA